MNKLFNNTKVAFSLKKDSELERAYFLFKMISYEPMVRIGTAATNFAIKAKLPVEGLIRSTVFDHFCGGVNEEDCLPVIDKMFTKGVSAVLDYSVEGKAEESTFDEARDKILKIIKFADEKEAMPIVVFKPTAFGRFYLYQKQGEGTTLNTEEQQEWDRVLDRFHSVCALAKEKDVEVLIDGEESWMQDTADDLCESLMRKYNTTTTIVYNTLQTYRWDRLEYLKELHERAKTDNFRVGFKIVRGAYMEKERKRAEEKGYKSPICDNKLATDENFDTCMSYILHNLNEISLFIGTHNEDSCYLAMKMMADMGIDKTDNNVWFGQLYGMSDHISFNLAKEGYNVAKYVPFGPVRDVMPYLIRRAEENTSVAGQTSRELNLLKQEKERRKL
jgi:proline dehydrogenase